MIEKKKAEFQKVGGETNLCFKKQQISAHGSIYVAPCSIDTLHKGHFCCEKDDRQRGSTSLLRLAYERVHISIYTSACSRWEALRPRPHKHHHISGKLFISSRKRAWPNRTIQDQNGQKAEKMCYFWILCRLIFSEKKFPSKDPDETPSWPLAVTAWL